MARATRGTSGIGPVTGTPILGPADIAHSLTDEQLTIDIRLFDDADDFFAAEGPEPDAPGAQAAPAEPTGPADAGTPESGAAAATGSEGKAADAGDATPGQSEPDAGGSPADGDEPAAEPTPSTDAKKYLGRYNTLEEAERAHKSLQTQYQQDVELIKRLGGREAVARLAEQQQSPQAAMPQTPQQRAGEIPDGMVDTPWGVMSEDDANNKMWEIGQYRYQQELGQYIAQREAEKVRQDVEKGRQTEVARQENTASVIRQMQEAHPDFDAFLPTILEIGREDPDVAERVDRYAGTDPDAYARIVENLYWQAKGRKADSAVAAAQKAGEAASQARQEQQRAANVGAPTARAPVQSQPTEDPDRDFFGEPRIG